MWLENSPLKAQKAGADGPDPSLNIKRGWVQCLVTARLSKINHMKPARWRLEEEKGEKEGVGGGRRGVGLPLRLLPPSEWFLIRLSQCEDARQPSEWQAGFKGHDDFGSESGSGSTWLPFTNSAWRQVITSWRQQPDKDLNNPSPVVCV